MKNLEKLFFLFILTSLLFAILAIGVLILSAATNTPLIRIDIFLCLSLSSVFVAIIIIIIDIILIKTKSSTKVNKND